MHAGRWIFRVATPRAGEIDCGENDGTMGIEVDEENADAFSGGTIPRDWAFGVFEARAIFFIGLYIFINHMTCAS